jgi:hypothetical protein
MCSNELQDSEDETSANQLSLQATSFGGLQQQRTTAIPKK